MKNDQLAVEVSASDINMDRIVAEFAELVRIDSVSGRERKLADVLFNKLRLLGLTVWEDDSACSMLDADRCGNILAYWPATAATEAPAVFLAAHMDTVEPGHDICPVMNEGKIYSVGETILGADDKAGIAAILEALRVVQERQLAHGPLEIIFTVGEEIGLLGAKALDCRQLQSKMGFICDGSGKPGTLVLQTPYHQKICFNVQGKAAHAAVCPEQGVNAIKVAAEALHNLHVGRIDAETTVNIGIISGGRATNIIPDSVYLEGEVRSLQMARVEQEGQKMIESFAAACERSGAQLTVNQSLYYSGFCLDPEEAVVRIARQAAARLGLTVRQEISFGGSDANEFNQRGMRALNLGVGMCNEHSSNEYIIVQDLVKTAAMVTEIIKIIAVGDY